MAEIRLEDLKGNSNKGRTVSTEKPRDTRVRTVAKGREVKKSAGRKFVDTFVKTDAKSIGEYVIGEVLVPTIVDTFIDICESTIEMLFRGERRSYRGRGSSNREKDKTSYQAYYKSDKPKERQVYSANGNGSFPVKDIRIEGMDTAEGYKSAAEIVDDIFGVLSDELHEYNQISVRDLYDCAGITSSNFQDNNYGWTSLRGFGKRRIDRDAYLLVIPRPEAI